MKKIEFSKTLIMGILNTTPDSFSDGGRFFDKEKAILHGIQMVKDGADIIDIGGESTRPFAKPVPLDEEINRTIPVIKGLSQKISVPISIDTTKAKVAQLAIESGASIINDISALRFDKDMIKVALQYNTFVILMHMKGTPQDMQSKEPLYNDLIGEIKAFLKIQADFAQANKIDKSKIIIDPGIGFGKTFRDNFVIIKNLRQFKDLGFKILIGPSRKAFVRNALEQKFNMPQKSIEPESLEVELGTQACICASVLNGANIVRVHNVKNTMATLAIINQI